MTDTATLPRTSGELHYPGRTEPKTGQLLGPDTHGRLWEVNGAVYDPDTDTTTVYADVRSNPTIADLLTGTEN